MIKQDQIHLILAQPLNCLKSRICHRNFICILKPFSYKAQIIGIIVYYQNAFLELSGTFLGKIVHHSLLIRLVVYRSYKGSVYQITRNVLGNIFRIDIAAYQNHPVSFLLHLVA